MNAPDSKGTAAGCCWSVHVMKNPGFDIYICLLCHPPADETEYEYSGSEEEEEEHDKGEPRY